MAADNGFGGLGPKSPTVVLMTLPAAVPPPTVAAVRMTEVQLTWTSTVGRQSSIVGYNVTYKAADAAPAAAAAGWARSDGPAPAALVTGLSPNRSYVFAVAPLNAAGAGPMSDWSTPATTVDLDFVAHCSLSPNSASASAFDYPPSPLSVSADLLLTESSQGQVTHPLVAPPPLLPL